MTCKPASMTREERRALIEAPITRGILATTSHGGLAIGGGSDGTKLPVFNPMTGLLSGWMTNPAPRVA